MPVSTGVTTAATAHFERRVCQRLIDTGMR